MSAPQRKWRCVLVWGWTWLGKATCATALLGSEHSLRSGDCQANSVIRTPACRWSGCWRHVCSRRVTAW